MAAAVAATGVTWLVVASSTAPATPPFPHNVPEPCGLVGQAEIARFGLARPHLRDPCQPYASPITITGPSTASVKRYPRTPK
ncbi:hypothetical protein M8542_09720 [Amycolatopsis sp. OK19-0408]|uniref:Secreted protein n=1 Tax=Amycolatopsis iheyensis TaxID=2945988 RepID=A0A9X2N9K0_9PSEU|nr:hypothetical protein [Amycolatopsis iheyensis]MCR6483096.1 hypothetical protein [Amycolatopsis iheyensis]